MAVTTVTEEQIRHAKVALIARGWTLRDLSEETGISYGVVRHVFAGSDKYWPAKMAINTALEQTVFQKPERTAGHVPMNRMIESGELKTRGLK